MTDFCVFSWEISFFTTPFPPCNEVDEGIGATWLKVHFKISSPREAEFEKKIKNLRPNVLLMHGWKWKKEYERMKYDDILYRLVLLGISKFAKQTKNPCFQDPSVDIRWFPGFDFVGRCFLRRSCLLCLLRGSCLRGFSITINLKPWSQWGEGHISATERQMEIHGLRVYTKSKCIWWFSNDYSDHLYCEHLRIPIIHTFNLPHRHGFLL